MNRVPVYSSKDLKKAQDRIYSALKTRTPYLVSGHHECKDKERYEYLADEDPSVILIETHSGMLKELNIALYVYYKHFLGTYAIADTMCPACNVETFWEKWRAPVNYFL